VDAPTLCPPVVDVAGLVCRVLHVASSRRSMYCVGPTGFVGSDPRRSDRGVVSPTNISSGRVRAIAFGRAARTDCRTENCHMICQ
jgi:hypothetical protein